MSQINVLTAEDTFMDADAEIQKLITEIICEWYYPILQIKTSLTMSTMGRRELDFVDNQTMSKFIDTMR